MHNFGEWIDPEEFLGEYLVYQLFFWLSYGWLTEHYCNIEIVLRLYSYFVMKYFANLCPWYLISKFWNMTKLEYRILNIILIMIFLYFLQLLKLKKQISYWSIDFFGPIRFFFSFSSWKKIITNSNLLKIYLRDTKEIIKQKYFQNTWVFFFYHKSENIKPKWH